MTESWWQSFVDDGYHLFKEMTPPALIADANRAIRDDLSESYDPKRQTEYDNISSCPDIRGSAPLAALLAASPIRGVLDQVLGWETIEHDSAQIAIRRARNHRGALEPEPHIDGIPTPYNGLQGSKISNFTALVGIFLTPIRKPYAGNLCVWPGSHRKIETYFRATGPDAQDRGMPALDYGSPEQLLCEPGDTILCHYQLAHAAAVNLSDLDRVAVYFRIWFKDIDDRRWELLTNIWSGWRAPID